MYSNNSASGYVITDLGNKVSRKLYSDNHISNLNALTICKANEAI